MLAFWQKNELAYVTLYIMNVLTLTFMTNPVYYKVEGVSGYSPELALSLAKWFFLSLNQNQKMDLATKVRQSLSRITNNISRRRKPRQTISNLEDSPDLKELWLYKKIEV